jgi:hypothetical protein
VVGFLFDCWVWVLVLFFGFCFLGFVLLSGLLVGGGPTATHFSCFAKKSKQKKATTLPLPFGFPIVQDKKWESFETRLRLKQRSFLYPFSALHNWQCQKWNCIKVKNNSNNKTNSIDHHGVQLG